MNNISGRNRLLFVLSLIGIIIATYVTQSFLRKVGIICLTSGCEIVRKNPASWPFGIPVPLFGLVGYSMLAVLTFLRTTTNDSKTTKKLLLGMLGVATFGMGFVTWFTYTELFIIKGICMWCAISTVIMYIVSIVTFTEWRAYVRSHR